MTTATTTEIKAKAENKIELVKAEKPEVKTEKKSEVKTESKSAVKTENKITVTPEVKAEKKSEVKTESKPEVKAEEQTAKNPPKDLKIKPQSAGAKIRAMFEKILTDGKITADVMKILTSTEETKKVLNIRYAFLKPVTKNPNDRKINGHARYGTAIIEINGNKFWLTNDLYAKQVEIFEKWTKTLYAEKKSEIKK